MRALGLALLFATACGADPHEAASAQPPEAANAGGGPSPLLVAASPQSQPDCERCNGRLTRELQAELTRRAQSTKPCYDQALSRRRDLQGELMIRVRVGRSGSVCTERVVADQIGDATFATCALTAFEGEALPAPEGGCIEVNVPLAFVPSDAGGTDGPATLSP